MRRAALILSFVAAIVGFSVSVLAFYPGVMSFDSIVQYEQARSGVFRDWHPPAMAALWSVLNRVHDGPELMFLLQLTLLWGGLCGVAIGLVRSGRAWGAAFPLIGLAPFVFDLVGVIWKDVVLAASWIFAAGVLFAVRAKDERTPRWLVACLGLSLLYGALVRANSVFAIAPLALYLVGGRVFGRALAPQIIACVAAPLAILGATAIVSGPMLHAAREHPLHSLILFDLVGITRNGPDDVIPGQWSAADRARIAGCYQPDKWDHLGDGVCAGVVETLQHQHVWGGGELRTLWVKAALTHPIAYLRHRLAFTNEMLRWRGPFDDRSVFYDSERTTPAAWRHEHNGLFQAAKASAMALRHTPLFRAYFWLVLSACVCALAAFAVDSAAKRFAAALGASGFIYLVTFIPFGVAADFRYAYWTILATLATGAALTACTWPKGRFVSLAAGSAIALVLAIATSTY